MRDYWGSGTTGAVGHVDHWCCRAVGACGTVGQ